MVDRGKPAGHGALSLGQRAADRVRDDDAASPASLLGHQGLVDPAAIIRPGAQAQSAIGTGNDARIAERVRNRYARRAAILAMEPVLSQCDTVRIFFDVTAIRVPRGHQGPSHMTMG